MRPDEPLDREKLGPLHSGGEWGAAEQHLRALLLEDPQDLSACCQLATLLALRGWEDDPRRRNEALRLYDACVVQGWSTRLCLNNQGVLWAQDGEAMPAVGALLQAASDDGGYGPALYNLAVLCQRAAQAGGGVPRLLRDQGVVGSDETLDAATRRWFEQALGDAEWAAGPLAAPSPPPWSQPLYLWVDDLSPSLGWLKTVTDSRYEEAEQYLSEGRLRMAAQDYDGALRHFEQAVALVPEFGPRVGPLHKQATLEHATVLRQQVRELWSTSQFPDARATLDVLLARLPDLPDQTLGLTMLADEAANLTRQLVAHPVASDRPMLLELMSSVGYLAAQYEEQYGSTREWLAARTPEGAIQTTLLRIKDPQQLWTEVRVDGTRVLRRELLVAVAADDEASVDELVALAGCGWLGEPLLRGLHREALTQLANGRLARAQGGVEKAARIQGLLAARKVAEKAGDEGLTAEIDRQLGVISVLHAEADDEVRRAFERGDHFAVLERYVELTREVPANPELESFREVAWRKQTEQLGRALKKGNWRAAYGIATRLGRLHPDDPGLSEQLERARRGLADQYLRRARLALQARQWEEAGGWLGRARELEPASEPLLALTHELDAARIQAAGEPAHDEFDHANQEFSRARGDADPVDALPHYLTMRGMMPAAPRTQEAAAWLFPAFALELDRRGRTPQAAAEIRAMLGTLLSLEMDRGDVRELTEALLRAEADTDARTQAQAVQRFQSVETLIAEADASASVHPPQPEQALQVLAGTTEYPLTPHQQARVAEIRTRALAVLRARFEARLAALPGAAAEAEAQALVAEIHRWDAAAAGQLAHRLHDTAAAGRMRAEHDIEVRELERLAGDRATRPATAWRLLQATLRARPHLAADPRVTTLQAQALARLPLPLRWWARVRERPNAVP